MKKNQAKYFSFVMWLLPLSFFAYQFILRLWPGLMINQIMEQFSINATYFGLLASFYYYGYAGMQIPVAILLDRYETRYVVCVFAVLCGIGSLVFTYTDNFYLATFSRFLVGGGSVVGFLAISKVVSQWFPKDQYAKMIGFSFTLGLMGAVYGGKPISLLIDTYTGHCVAVVLALISMMMGILAYCFLRSPSKPDELSKEDPFKIADFQCILKSKMIWGLAFSNLLMVGALEGFADVWGVRYLMVIYEVEKSTAAAVVSNIFYGMIIGGPLLALLSKKIGNYLTIALCGLGMACSFGLLIFNHQYHGFLTPALFFIIGVMCCYQVIIFAAGSQMVEARQLGVTIAFLNCINMLGGSFFHTIIGFVMDYFWTGTYAEEGIKSYSIETFTWAMSIIPLCALLGALIVAVIAYQKNKKILSIEV